MLDLPAPVSIYDAHGNMLFVARSRDTDEAAIKAAGVRGVQLPSRIVIYRGGCPPRVYDVTLKGAVLNVEETAKRGY